MDKFRYCLVNLEKKRVENQKKEQELSKPKLFD